MKSHTTPPPPGEALSILSIDELYLNQRYRCILTNVEEKMLLDLLPSRRLSTINKYLIGQQKSRSAWACGIHPTRWSREAATDSYDAEGTEACTELNEPLKGNREILFKRAYEILDCERLIMLII
jgi:hypothetical protein